MDFAVAKIHRHIGEAIPEADDGGGALLAAEKPALGHVHFDNQPVAFAAHFEFGGALGVGGDDARGLAFLAETHRDVAGRLIERRHRERHRW